MVTLETPALKTLYGGQLTLSTQLIIPNYPVILSHWCSTTVSLETYPLFSFNEKNRVHQSDAKTNTPRGWFMRIFPRFGKFSRIINRSNFFSRWKFSCFVIGRNDNFNWRINWKLSCGLTHNYWVTQWANIKTYFRQSFRPISSLVFVLCPLARHLTLAMMLSTREGYGSSLLGVEWGSLRTVTQMFVLCFCCSADALFHLTLGGRLPEFQSRLAWV